MITTMKNEGSSIKIEEKLKILNRKRVTLICIFLFLTLIVFLFSLFIGTSKISFVDCILGLFNKSENNINRIMQNIRLPRAIAALICGGALSISGLIMQTTLNNEIASPSTLGVSNAATFGANIAIIVYSGGFVAIGNNGDLLNAANPYITSIIAFIFAVMSTLIVLSLCKIKSFNPTSVVLAGLAIGALFSALTSIVQYYASDIGLSAAIIWSFGDLSKTTFEKNIIIGVITLLILIFFFANSKKYNALLSGDESAKSLGVNVELLRFLSLVFASLLTSISVALFGIIGFVGIVCPHICKKVIGNSHYFSIPLSFLCGSILLILADTFSRIIANGNALPVGAITSLIGAPFFLYLIFAKKDKHLC